MQIIMRLTAGLLMAMGLITLTSLVYGKGVDFLLLSLLSLKKGILLGFVNSKSSGLYFFPLFYLILFFYRWVFIQKKYILNFIFYGFYYFNNFFWPFCFVNTLLTNRRRGALGCTS